MIKLISLDRFLAGVVSMLLGYGTAWAGPQPGSPGPATAPAGLNRATPSRLRGSYGKLPLSFEPNEGQAEPRVKFLSRGKGYALFLTGDEVALALERSKAKSKVKRQISRIENQHSGIGAQASSPRRVAHCVLRVKFVGAKAPLIMGEEELPGKSNYFIGSDPRQWHTNLPTFAKVRYQSVYPGVDLVFYGEQGRLEYDFVVAPGGDPKVIALRIESGNGEPEIRNHGLETRESRNAKSEIEPLPQIDSEGSLVLRAAGGAVFFHKPLVYQPAWGSRLRTYIDGRYVLQGRRRIGFEIAYYDHTRPLVIDPILSYSSYLGGSDADTAYAIALDSSGEACVTGSTLSANFPTAPAKTPLQSASGGGSDVFVTKVNATGSALVYSTYLGGVGFDQASSIAVDASGNAYVTGNTSSTNFPTTKGAFQTTYGGNSDAFVAKLDPTGAMLVYSSYLGGSGADFGQGIALDSSGNAYITGSTQSSDFPTTKGIFQAGNGGSTDAFVCKVKADGSALTYSTFLGGSGADSGQGIAVDSSGNAYVTGFTFSTNFPATAGAFQSTNSGNGDAFVTKLNPAGSGLVYSTYLGGSGQDRGFAIAIDSSGSAYLTGDTESINFPATVGAFQSTNSGNGDAFVAKLNAAGSAFDYFTFLGGSEAEQGTGIAVDASGNAFVTGFTRSSNFPTLDPLQASLGGGTCGVAPSTFPCADVFVSKLNAQGSALFYSTFLGGNGEDFGQAIALDSSGNAYVAGGTASLNFPPASGAFQSVFGGSTSTGDAFVAKIAAIDRSAVALSPQLMAFGNQGKGSTSAPQTVTLTSVGSLPLNISSLTISGTNSADFALAPPPASALPACPTSGTVAAAGGTCSISVTFTPSSKAAETASLVIADDAGGSPQQVALTGTGVTPAPAVTFSPTSLTFGSQSVGTSSPPQSVTLTNSGSSALSITKISVTGDFSQTDTCSAGAPSSTSPATLNPGASCTFSIIFKPTGAGSASRTGSLSITDNATGSPQTVALAGSGIAEFSLSATATSSTITVGTTSTTFKISASATNSFISSITLACTIGSGAACTFNPTSIKPGQSSTLTVGSLSATTTNPLSFTANGTSGSQTASVTLTIVLAAFTLSASPPLDLIKAGQSATYTVSVIPSNGFNQSVSLSCGTPLPTAATCSFSPSSVTPKGSVAATAVLTVKTTSNSRSGPRPTPRFPPRTSPLGMLWLLTFATVAALAARRRWSHSATDSPKRLPLSRLALGATLLFVAVWSGCNQFTGFGLIGTGGVPGTPPGNYTLIITGTFKGPSGSSISPPSITVNLSVS